uniref:Uncharacterized protein n=1 Tax=Hyaloperonospora arabidopsidis (strain Emoy2) TaxID=559515 RepID=M4C0B4_HYAAE
MLQKWKKMIFLCSSLIMMMKNKRSISPRRWIWMKIWTQVSEKLLQCLSSISGLDMVPDDGE